MAEGSSESSQISHKNQQNEEDINGITMLDVLKEEQELEDDAEAVLGASDDRNCTYSQGYVKRQALYACVSCIPKSEEFKPGGICLACSYHCHEGHELVELYTKRNFKCDCGNSRFSKKCTLEPNKAGENVLNNYNQNFRGLYCTCKRPYPDPDDEMEDEMIQCIICEDWYHGRHLGTSIPAQHNYAEMVCGQCMKCHSFLTHYLDLSVKINDNCKPDVSNSDFEKRSDKNTSNSEKTEEKSEYNSINIVEENGHKNSDGDCVPERCILNETNETGCKLKSSKSVICGDKAVFFNDGWRKNLCTCLSCKELYESEKVSFLMDENDTVQAYEEKGKSSTESQYEKGLKALTSLNRVQQVDIIQGYNDMKSQLVEYLQKFKENKKVVREEDIREFFSGMEARKRQRQQHSPPYFCH